MQKFILSLFIDSIAVLACSYLMPGANVEGFGSALLVSMALALLNQFVKPILVIFTIPATILTFGVFLLIINTLIIQLADWMVFGFSIDGFWVAFYFSLILTLIKSVFNAIAGTNRQQTTDED